MEFLSRTWSVSALEVSKALAPPHPHPPPSKSGGTILSVPENVTGGQVEEHSSSSVSLNQFSLASSATSQLVLERIMSQSEISPLTSGRLSHSSGPLNGTDSPPISPSEDYDDVVKFFLSNKTLQPLFTGGRTHAGNSCSTPGGTKTVGRWLKDKKEKKKEEARTHNAQLHAAVSVAAVAAAIAAIAAATAASSASGKNGQSAKTDMAVASAAALVAAQCVEAAEVLGAERDHLTSVVSSAVNVRSHDDIVTLTAAAATALRGAATLKARALKEVWNITAVLPVDKAMGAGLGRKRENRHPNGTTYNGDLVHEENFLAICNQELLAQGSELLKRTRNGDLHLKIVSVYINRMGQVILKMKSKHVAGTITKKKKNVVLEVYKDMPAWPGRHLLGGREQRRYFGLRTESRGIVEFECKNQKEYDIWTQGVSRLLFIVTEKKNKHLA